VLIAAAKQLTTIPAQFEQTLSAVPDKDTIFTVYGDAFQPLPFISLLCFAD